MPDVTPDPLKPGEVSETAKDLFYGPSPVTVTVPASSMTGTGPGTLVTPQGQPNIVVKVVQPLVVVFVRATNVYLQTFLGLITAGLAAPKAIPVADFAHLMYLAAGLSVAPAVVCVVQNTITLLTKFDQSFPTLSA